jgi:hypothetical protein
MVMGQQSTVHTATKHLTLLLPAYRRGRGGIDDNLAQGQNEILRDYYYLD